MRYKLDDTYLIRQMNGINDKQPISIMSTWLCLCMTKALRSAKSHREKASNSQIVALKRLIG